MLAFGAQQCRTALHAAKERGGGAEAVAAAHARLPGSVMPAVNSTEMHEPVRVTSAPSRPAVHRVQPPDTSRLSAPCWPLNRLSSARSAVGPAAWQCTAVPLRPVSSAAGGWAQVHARWPPTNPCRFEGKRRRADSGSVPMAHSAVRHSFLPACTISSVAAGEGRGEGRGGGGFSGRGRRQESGAGNRSRTQGIGGVADHSLPLPRTRAWRPQWQQVAATSAYGGQLAGPTAYAAAERVSERTCDKRAQEASVRALRCSAMVPGRESLPRGRTSCSESVARPSGGGPRPLQAPSPNDGQSASSCCCLGAPASRSACTSGCVSLGQPPLPVGVPISNADCHGLLGSAWDRLQNIGAPSPVVSAPRA